MLWDLIDAPTTSHHMLSLCARSFTEIDHNATKNVIGMQYATPWPRHVLIPWSPDHVISPQPSYHPCVPHTHNYPYACPLPIPKANFLDLSSLPCRFSLIISSIISSSFYTSSLPWFYFQNLKESPEIFGKYSLSNWPKSTQNLIRIPLKIFLWVQWHKLNTNPLD
jgi:hypothetical protein